MADDARVRALREATRIAPDDVELRRLLADALLAAGDAEAAIAEYRACLRADHDDRGTLIGLARAFHASGKRSAALMTLEDLLARTGDDAEAGVLQARILHEAGRSDEAAAAYHTAIEADPRHEDPALAAAIGAALAGGQGPVPVPGGQSPAGTTPASTPSAAAPASPASDTAPPLTEPPGDGEPPQPARPVGLPAFGPGDGDGEALERTFEMERPRITFDQVGGMEGLKDEIRTRIIAPIEHPDLYAAYGMTAGGGILMYGPPGCGKTHLARATAGQVRATFLAVGINDILDMWLGKSERNLHDFFDTARRHQPCVLFFDEVDALGGSRTDMRGSAGRTVVNQFLAELDGAEASNDGVLVLAATNAPWHLDPAFRRPGRFDRVLFVPPPDAQARIAILEILLAGKPVGQVDYRAVASKTEGFSGADLRGVVDLAVETKLRQAMLDHIPRPIVTRDLLDALRRTAPTTRDWFATARNYVLYANQGGLYDAVRPYLQL